MGNRLYVGNLSFNASSESVRQAFEKFGGVSEVAIITDRETGQPRGFAFVTMASPEAAAAAISGMNGTHFEGRPLRVNEAEDRPRGGGGGGGGGGFRGRGDGGGRDQRGGGGRSRR